MASAKEARGGRPRLRPASDGASAIRIGSLRHCSARGLGRGPEAWPSKPPEPGPEIPDARASGFILPIPAKSGFPDFTKSRPNRDPGQNLEHFPETADPGARPNRDREIPGQIGAGRGGDFWDFGVCPEGPATLGSRSSPRLPA
jgi:hypothetical protein